MIILEWLAGLVIAAGAAAVAGLLNDESRARLEQLPSLLLAAAIRRLPEKIRADVAEEWRAELDHILHRFEAYPLTRLLCGIRFAAGLLRAAPSIGSDLVGVRTKVPRRMHPPNSAGLRAGMALVKSWTPADRLFITNDVEARWRGWGLLRIER